MPADATRPGSDAKHDAAMLAWMLPLFVAGGAFLALARLLAGPLALPVLSLLLLGAGFLLAAGLLPAGSRPGSAGNAAWTIAAVLVFLGFAAALLSDGRESLAELERLEVHGVKAASN